MDFAKGLFSSLFGGSQQPAVQQPKPVQQAKMINFGPIPDVDIPMNSKSPSSMINYFWKILLRQLRTNLQQEFADNATRVNTEEDELNPEKSKSFLPTVSRAVREAMPTILGGFMSLLANLLNALLGLFGVKKTTQDSVTKGIKALGQGLFSNNSGEGLKEVVENAAPVLMQGLNDALNLGLPADVMQAATVTPVAKKPVPSFTPTMDIPEMTQEEIDEAYGVSQEDLEERQRQNSSWFPWLTNPMANFTRF